ncbi:MAG: glycerate kinase [Oscillospiraceae bacterium]|nr:glycerate kinase [Oscillospiraceae bacterium]
MNKYILIPDSFKGTMSSSEICAIMKTQIAKHDKNARIISIPVADGGEGSVDCFLEAIGGEKIGEKVCGPFLDETADAFYGLLENGKTAVIEMAACAGLPMVKGRENPLLTTTYGVGELILKAARVGAKNLIIGLGGSATNDGGCGAAAAIGYKFTDKTGKAFVPTGGSLKDIAKISGGKPPELDGIKITAMCDIDNPLYGTQGAAHIFGPQKGASPDIVEALDAGLMHLAKIIARDIGTNVHKLPGSGAAGGLGAGMAAFFGAPLKMGIDIVLDTVGFEEKAKGANLILTGEGKIDTQSLRGKVVIGVARRAKPLGVPVIAVVGDIGDDIESAYEEGVSGIISINRIATDMQTAKKRSREDMALTVDNLMRIINAIRNL